MKYKTSLERMGGDGNYYVTIWDEDGKSLATIIVHSRDYPDGGKAAAEIFQRVFSEDR